MNILNFLNSHKIKVRLVYWISFALIMLFVVMPLFFFFYLFDEGKVKQMIIDQFDNNNYNVAVVGNVTPKLWHGLSLEINNIDVSNKQYQKLMTIKHFNCQLSWFALALGQYNIKKIALDDVELDQTNVIKYGLNNLVNLSKNNNTRFFGISEIAASGIHSVDSGDLSTISDGSLKLYRDGTSLEFKLGFKIDSKNTYFLADGTSNLANQDKINFDPFNLYLYGKRLKASIKSQAVYDPLARSLSINNSNGMVAINNFAGSLSLTNLLLSVDKITADKFNLKLSNRQDLISQKIDFSFNNLTSINLTKFNLSNSNLLYHIDLDSNSFDINSTLGNLVVDNNLQIYSDECNNHITGTLNNFNRFKLNANLNGVCNYNNASHLIDLNFDGDINNSPLNLAIHISDLDKKPNFNLDGNIESVTFSSIDQDKSKLLPLYSDDSPIPFAWLSLLNLNASLNFKQFNLDRISLRDVSTNFAVKDNTLTVSKIKSHIYNGDLFGSLKITKHDANYDIVAKEVLRNLNLNVLLTDLFNVKAISGNANLTLNVSANNVVSYSDLHKKLNGSVSVDASRGAFAGVDLNIFASPGNKVSLLPVNQSTIFDHLQANFNFINGISKNGSLSFSSAYVIANGSGLMNFVNDQINYNLIIKSALPQNQEKINSVVIPIAILGPLFSPKLSIQNIHLLSDELKKPAPKGVIITRKKPSSPNKKTPHKKALHSKHGSKKQHPQ